MNRLVLRLLLVLIPLAAFCGEDGLNPNTVTLGVGGLPYTDNPLYPNLQRGGPTFTGNYEYRLWKYVAVEGGTDILLPSGQSFVRTASLPPGFSFVTLTKGANCTACVVEVSQRSRVALLTYGFKGVLPLARDRAEVFAGLGGAYGWNSEFRGLNSAFAQASLGGRFSLDRGRRFWLGTTLRGFSSFGPGRQAWVPLTFDFGIRFGR